MNPNDLTPEQAQKIRDFPWLVPKHLLPDGSLLAFNPYFVAIWRIMPNGDPKEFDLAAYFKSGGQL